MLSLDFRGCPLPPVRNPDSSEKQIILMDSMSIVSNERINVCDNSSVTATNGAWKSEVRADLGFPKVSPASY